VNFEIEKFETQLSQFPHGMRMKNGKWVIVSRYAVKLKYQINGQKAAIPLGKFYYNESPTPSANWLAIVFASLA